MIPWLVVILGFALFGAPFVARPLRFLIPDGSAARMAVIATEVSVLLVAAVLATVSAAPHELAGGDQCAVLSPHEQGFIKYAVLVVLCLAPVAISAAISGWRSLRGALGVVICSVFSLSAAFMGLLTMLFLGACGS